MDIFLENDYRAVLRTCMDERKKLDPSATYQKMAERMRIPKSYLSRVLGGNNDLSADQLYLACLYLGFSDDEREYMGLLLDLARSVVKARRDEIVAKIEARRTARLQTKEHLSAATIVKSSTSLAEYYFDPLNHIVHMALAIDRYKRNQQLLAKSLQVDPDRIVTAVAVLERLGLVRRTDASLELVVDSLHLPPESPFYRSWRNHLKTATHARLELAADPHAYTFSVAFTASETVRRQIRQRFLGFLTEIEALVGTAPAEDVYQLSFDLFAWTTS